MHPSTLNANLIINQQIGKNNTYKKTNRNKFKPKQLLHKAYSLKMIKYLNK